jgi:hypothetical protein
MLSVIQTTPALKQVIVLHSVDPSKNNHLPLARIRKTRCFFEIADMRKLRTWASSSSCCKTTWMSTTRQELTLSTLVRACAAVELAAHKI